MKLHYPTNANQITYLPLGNRQLCDQNTTYPAESAAYRKTGDRDHEIFYNIYYENPLRTHAD
jgi:hypothetical protein